MRYFIFIMYLYRFSPGHILILLCCGVDCNREVFSNLYLLVCVSVKSTRGYWIYWKRRRI